jgi:hypothetical protein
MLAKLTLILALAYVTNAEETFYNFKTTWSVNIFGYFNDQPRTMTEAGAAGWRIVWDGCADGADVKYVQGVHLQPFQLN